MSFYLDHSKLLKCSPDDFKQFSVNPFRCPRTHSSCLLPSRPPAGRPSCNPWPGLRGPPGGKRRSQTKTEVNIQNNFTSTYATLNPLKVTKTGRQKEGKKACPPVAQRCQHQAVDHRQLDGGTAEASQYTLHIANGSKVGLEGPLPAMEHKKSPNKNNRGWRGWLPIRPTRWTSCWQRTRKKHKWPKKHTQTETFMDYGKKNTIRIDQPDSELTSTQDNVETKTEELRVE